MPDGAHKGSFIQGYNAQLAVDAEAQIIVAVDVTQHTQDKRQLIPMAEKVIDNVGRLADTTSADAGYFSEHAVDSHALAQTNLLVPPDRLKHGHDHRGPNQPPAENASSAQRMRHKLRTEEGRSLYKRRKAIVEPVFGQIKAVRGLRSFLLRGIDRVREEFSIIAMTHNLLKLFRFSTASSQA